MNKGRLSASENAQPRDIFVDLDGTLLRSDVLIETAWRYLRANPLKIFLLIGLMLRGPAVAKAMLARQVKIDPASLPYEGALIDRLKQYKGEGRRIFLMTASHWTHAERIAKHHGLFDGAFGSRGRVNLKGAEKLDRIRGLVGSGDFIYAGDSAADRPIWAAAKGAIFVNAPARDIVAANSRGAVELQLNTRPNWKSAFLKEMRLHQWAKNALLFVPLLTSHHYTDPTSVGMTLVAFLAMGLCASGHYFTNDLLDLDSDRAHTTKRLRPLAYGDLPLAYGVAGAVVLPVLSFVISGLLLPWAFTAWLAAYFLITNAYSFYLKRTSTADVMTLAVLYSIRVIAGAAAISVAISSWLLAFSMFIFLSLSYLKRYVELRALEGESGSAKGRGYSAIDAETMFTLGVANTTAATMVLALYISSSEVTALYRHPGILWGLCLLMLYWSNRMWIGARRSKINQDPVVFALKDNISRVIAILVVVVVLAARLLP